MTKRQSPLPVLTPEQQATVERWQSGDTQGTEQLVNVPPAKKSLKERLDNEAKSRRQSHCPHQRLATSITHPLICQQCQLDDLGVLLVAVNDRLMATIAALAKVGLEPCVTCQELFPKNELLALPVDANEAAHDEQLHRLYCAGDAVSRIEMDEIPLTDEWLRWFGAHLQQGMPSWLRQEMTERIGYRSLDLEPPKPSDERCTRCGLAVALTPDWTLWPWPDGARLCASCNDQRHETEEYP